MRNFAAKFQKSIPWPQGPQRTLILYRWLVAAVGIYTVIVTWNVWQVRSAADWHPWKFATPNFKTIWHNRPTDAQLAPMLPAWDWLPQFDVGWLLVVGFLLVLIRPKTGLFSLAIIWVLSVLMDRTRLQPHYEIWFLMLATLPSAGAQLVGRANLISMWFWAGFHKLISDFIKPDGLLGFKNDIIPSDLARMFPPERYPWSSHALGVTLGWSVSLTEMTLGLLCFFPRARRLVGIGAIALHGGIILWNCLAPVCNIVGWNIALMLAGFALIVPWRENPVTSWKGCRWPARILALALLVYPAGYYIDLTNAYLSHCIYVPNTPYGELRRLGETPKAVPFVPFEVINFPLPSGQSIIEQYFDKTKLPGDMMFIFDPRPWAQHNGTNGRILTFDGELRNNLPYGHWIRHDDQQNKLSEGDFNDHGVETGLWTYWYSDGHKAMQGHYVDGQPEGVWSMWTPEGEETQVEFHDGQAVTQKAAQSNSHAAVNPSNSP